MSGKYNRVVQKTSEKYNRVVEKKSEKNIRE